MTETILTALIGSGVALVVCLINNAFQQKRYEQQQQQTIEMLSYKLEQLTKKVDEHNGLVERMYRIEETASVYEEKINVANHRIKDLERHVGAEMEGHA